MEQQMNQPDTTWKPDTVYVGHTLYAGCAGLWVLLADTGNADPAATFHFECSVPSDGSIGRLTVPN